MDLLQKIRIDGFWQATVLLNANVAFLAIQSVDSAAPPLGRTIAQRFSYISTVANVSAIVIELVLVMLHNTSLKVLTHSILYWDGF